MIADILIALSSTAVILPTVYSVERFYYKYTFDEHRARNYVSSRWDFYSNRAQIPAYAHLDLLGATQL